MSILLKVLYHGDHGCSVYVVNAPIKQYFEENMASSAFFVAYARVTLTNGIVTRMTGYSMQRNMYMPQVGISEIRARLIVKKEVIGIDWIV